MSQKEAKVLRFTKGFYYFLQKTQFLKIEPLGTPENGKMQLASEMCPNDPTSYDVCICVILFL
jgi:hypothetical protein